MNIYDSNDESYGPNLLCEEIGCLKNQVFWNDVDETNGCEEGEMHCPGYISFEIAVPAVIETCNLGHVHVIQEERYVIPTKR